MDIKPIKIIDLFSGIGGIRLGFENAFGNDKIKCVFSSEINKFSVQTYYSNFYEFPYGDINEFDPYSIPEHDILMAGFPCQPFSKAGLLNGFEDERGTLIFKIIEILAIKKPKVFFLENVKNLINIDFGNTFKSILDNLKIAGYNNINYKVLNSKDFGLPQSRSRVYIIGFLNNSIRFNFPDPINIKTKLSDILLDEVKDKYTLSDNMWKGHLKRKEKNLKRRYGFGYKMYNKDSEFSGTLTARYGNDGCEILIEQKNKNPRKLTPRECARLQGFPDSFKIPVSDNQAYKQFGNSVAINVIEAIANEIKKVI